MKLSFLIHSIDGKIFLFVIHAYRDCQVDNFDVVTNEILYLSKLNNIFCIINASVISVMVESHPKIKMSIRFFECFTKMQLGLLIPG